MKKIICAFLLVALISSACCSALAEAFDYTQLEDLDGYSYDKFNKTWAYQRSYIKEYADAYVVVGFSLEGDTNELSYPPILFIKILDLRGASMYMVDTVYFLIGEKLYYFDSLIETGDLSAAFLGSIGEQLLEDLAKGTDISIKIEFDYKSLDFDIPSGDIADSLTEFAKSIRNQNIYSIFTETELLSYDLIFNALVE